MQMRGLGRSVTIAAGLQGLYDRRGNESKPQSSLSTRALPNVAVQPRSTKGQLRKLGDNPCQFSISWASGQISDVGRTLTDLLL